MISILEHIEYLMAGHDCVIVPGFGAFIARYDSAYCESDGINWHRPERQISFNGELIHNDGLLAGSIMRKEGCAFGVANDAISESVASFHKQLSAEGELSFGSIGIFKIKNKNIVFVPRRANVYDFYGIGSFSMRPLCAAELPGKDKIDGNWRFSLNKDYLKIAASILVLLVLSFVLSTPISNKKGQQEYASMSTFGISSEGAFPYVSEVKELAISLPPRDTDSVVVRGYKSGGGSVVDNDKYFLIVCSVLSQAEADKFIAGQSGNYTYKVLAKNGKYRVYVATGNSVNELMKLKYAIADDYPDAWVHYSR